MAKRISVALAGNPNSGKTTIFNNITGGREHIGNWPGVTVEKKEGERRYKGHDLLVVDLPGTYSLTAYSLEELIARNFVVEEKPDVVVGVVDASNLERNLYLALQLKELGVKLILAFNMIDIARHRGDHIDIQELSELLGVPIIPSIGHRNIGTEQLLEKIIEVAGKEVKTPHIITYGGEIEHHLTRISDEIEKEIVLSKRYRPRWLALKLLEEDEVVTRIIKEKFPQILAQVKKTKEHLREIFDDDSETVIVDQRYGFLSGAVKETVKKRVRQQLSASDKIDRIVTNRLLGMPIFLALMWVAFKLTFDLGAPLVGWIDSGVNWLGETAASILSVIHSPAWFISFLVDGVIGGVGSVLIFLPNIFLLFFAIALLEDSGYMARAAFIMDRVMHKIGLHGKSFIPMLMGFGCNVPAIMATRTLENKKDRILTILINPLMSCAARLPVYVLMAGAFFGAYASHAIFSIYLMGIVLAVLMGFLFKRLFFPGLSAPFVMELPPYRIPTLKGLLIHMWERGSMFLKKAGTVIFLGVIAIWLLGSLPWGVEYASEASFAGALGHFFAPVLKPLGFDWRASVALIFGFVAKEIVVGTFGTLFHVGEEGVATALQQIMTPLSAYAFMAFTLIYIPCLATIGVIKKETGSWGWTAFAVAYGLVLAWIVAFIIYQGGRLLGLG